MQILSSYTASLPVANQYDLSVIGLDHETLNNPSKLPRYEDLPDSSDEKVISVRITSSVAVGRGKPMYKYPSSNVKEPVLKDDPPKVTVEETQTQKIVSKIDEQTGTTSLPPNLIGANIEYLKQINAKKESRENNSGQMYPMVLPFRTQNNNDDELLRKTDEYEESILDVPLARKVPSTADANRFEDQRSIQRFRNSDTNSPIESYLPNPYNDTTRAALFQPSMEHVSESSSNDDQIVKNVTTINDAQTDHKETRDTDLLTAIGPFRSNNKNDQSDDSVAEPSIKSVEFAKYNEAIENIPPTASMLPGHSPNNLQGLTNRPLNEGQNSPRLTTVSFNIVHDTPKTTNDNEPKTTLEHQPEKNYEVDEKISVLTDGRSHGVQPEASTEKCKQENCKVGYVLEGRQFKKYRVEERTPDGFIVGEYGVVRNEDGALRGVRYTADSDASPRLIHDALMKFLQLT
ncbi:hypothetical protein HW555_004545 [Spodoptera exigua]|uniref:Uncharacterized protein n=1 Tax=Spodoptera exigua TaxID=7107 RepID=A0A835GM84_SPOEX|nr:hypothetical protein HW555_004545 [Spodoptera exigua]